jgi:hypothetical protein
MTHGPTNFSQFSVRVTFGLPELHYGNLEKTRILNSHIRQNSNIISLLFLQWSRDSSVRIVFDYGLNDRGSIPDRGRGFFF